MSHEITMNNGKARLMAGAFAWIEIRAQQEREERQREQDAGLQ